MKRIIMHWTAGGHTPSNTDLEHYHFVIAGDGSVHPGRHLVSANENPVPGKYAAHTLNCNTGSIGVSVAAMSGAKERPFDRGKYPITDAQVKSLAKLCVRLCDEYGISVGRETVLTHAEVQPTLGIKQNGKWDISWLPDMTAPGSPVIVGDRIREMVREARRVTPAPKKPNLLDLILKLMGIKK